MKRDEWQEAMENEAGSVRDVIWSGETFRSAQWRKHRGTLEFFLGLALFQQAFTHPDALTILAGMLGAGWGMGFVGQSLQLVTLGAMGYIIVAWLTFGLFSLLGLRTVLPELGFGVGFGVLGLAFAGACLGHLSRYAVNRVKEAWQL